MIISEDLNRSLRDFTVVIVRVGGLQLRVSSRVILRYSHGMEFEELSSDLANNHHKDNISINVFLPYHAFK